MQIICGVDVAKCWLDAWVLERHRRFANTAEGVEKLLGFCRDHGV